MLTTRSPAISIGCFKACASLDNINRWKWLRTLSALLSRFRLTNTGFVSLCPITLPRYLWELDELMELYSLTFKRNKYINIRSEQDSHHHPMYLARPKIDLMRQIQKLTNCI
jgi:hypothetical protein